MNLWKYDTVYVFWSVTVERDMEVVLSGVGGYEVYRVIRDDDLGAGWLDACAGGGAAYSLF